MPTPALCPNCAGVLVKSTVHRDMYRCPNCQRVLHRSREDGSQVTFHGEVDVIPLEKIDDSGVAEQAQILDVIPVTMKGPPPSNKGSSYLDRLALGIAHHYLGKILFLILIAPLGGIYLIVNQCVDGIPRSARQTPQVLTCRDLTETRVEDKAFIALTDFHMGNTQVVAEPLGCHKDIWKKAWILVYPTHAAEAGSLRHVLLEMEEGSTLAQLEKLASSGRIQGLVRPADNLLEFSERVRIQLEYPDLELKDCYILQHGTTPPTPLEAYLLLGLGVALVLTGVPIYYVAWRCWHISKDDPSAGRWPKPG